MRNTALAQEVMQHLNDHPDTHRQGIYLDIGECGTVGCFAGWTCLLSGYYMTARVVDGERYVNVTRDDEGQQRAQHPGNVASLLLGLDHREAMRLFAGCNTRPVLELMVKDYVNGDEIKVPSYYFNELET